MATLSVHQVYRRGEPSPLHLMQNVSFQANSVCKAEVCNVTLSGGVTIMTTELSKQERGDAIASMQRYFRENFSEEIGDMPAGLFLNYVLEEIGPAIYNKAIEDARMRMEQRVMDLPGELFAEGFQYWTKLDARRKKR